MEWIARWGIMVIAAVRHHCVWDAGFFIHLSSSCEAFMQAFKSHICSFSFYLHHPFDLLQSHSFTHSLVELGVWRYWFEEVHTELTDAQGGVTEYVIWSASTLQLVWIGSQRLEI